MWPDERIVAGVMAAAVRRSRVLAMAEALAWGAVGAAITPVAGALLAVAVAVWRWRAASRATIVRTLEHAHPEARNLFVTVDELRDDRLIVKPVIRQRVCSDAARTGRKFRGKNHQAFHGFSKFGMDGKDRAIFLAEACALWIFHKLWGNTIRPIIVLKMRAPAPPPATNVPKARSQRDSRT